MGWESCMDSQKIEESKVNMVYSSNTTYNKCNWNVKF